MSELEVLHEHPCWSEEWRFVGATLRYCCVSLISWSRVASRSPAIPADTTSSPSAQGPPYTKDLVLYSRGSPMQRPTLKVWMSRTFLTLPVFIFQTHNLQTISFILWLVNGAWIKIGIASLQQKNRGVMLFIWVCFLLVTKTRQWLMAKWINQAFKIKVIYYICYISQGGR